MADTKISALPASTTPLAGTEVLPIVQSGTTKKTSIESVLTSVQPSGTANGVTYLNGSKVLTSGSALTFDGTNLGVGTASPVNKFVVSNAGAAGFEVNPADASGVALAFYNRSGAAYVNSIFYANSQIFCAGGTTEGMRLTSTGLGIGTSSPSVKLDVTGAGRFNSSGEALTIGSSSLAANTAQYFRNTSGYGVLALTSAADQYLSGVVAGDFIIASNGKSLRFGNANTGTLQATLDSSGNLGLGVTPSAWNTDYRVYQLAGGGALFNNGGSTFLALSQNNFVNSSSENRYIATAAATRYRQSAGTHIWDIAPSGTAGNAISFTQAMTLSAAGELLVGRTSSSGLGQIQSDNGADLASGSGSVYLVRGGGNVGIGTSSPGNKFVVSAAGAQGFEVNPNVSGTTEILTYNRSGSAWNPLKIITSNFKINISGGSDALTLDSSGNLGLGVAPSAWGSSIKALQMGFAGSTAISGRTDAFQSNFTQNAYDSGSNTWVYLQSTNANRYSMASGQHQWFTAPSGTAGAAISFTQAMTLDASGNLGIGATSSLSPLTLQRSGGDSAEIKLNQTGSGGRDYRIGSTGSGYGSAGNLIFYDATAGAERARIDSSGNLLVGQTSAGASNSDSLCFNGPASGGSVVVNHVNGSASGSGYAFFAYNAGVIGSITQSGTTAVLYNVTSDQRLKENIQDAAPASALIDSIKVRQYDWKADGNHQRYGFIAQELVTVAPEAVHQPADPEEMMAVDYSKLVPMLVKEIQSLRQRLAAAGI
jgi:hypothetical protein